MMLITPPALDHWAAHYVGLPWVKGAEGPHAYDCWGLVRHVQRAHFHRELPAIDLDALDLAAIEGVLAGGVHDRRWLRTPHPLEGDGVIVAQGRNIHVGVWIDYDGGRVLHSVGGWGVVCTDLLRMRAAGMGRLRFYRAVS
jgi:cell wall-associated NlpC family hydrolase